MAPVDRPTGTASTPPAGQLANRRPQQTAQWRAPAQAPPGPPAPRSPADLSQPSRGARAERRARLGRPDDRRQAAVYDALLINEGVLDEVWFSSSIDVFRLVASIAIGAMEAYDDDPASYADWVAVHRSGNCDCH